MRLAQKIGLSLSLIHSIVFFVGAESIVSVFISSIYLPLVLFAYLGLPVTDNYSGFGWSGPSGFGYAMIIIFWLGVWFLVGYIIERILKRNIKT